MEPLSSAAITISTLILNKAYEKTGEKLGEAFTNQLGKVVTAIKGKILPKTQAIEAIPETANYQEAVEELELATKSDVQLATLVEDLAELALSDPLLLTKIGEVAVLVNDKPSIIQNQTKLAEKIGLVVQSGEVNIENFSF